MAKNFLVVIVTLVVSSQQHGTNSR